MSLHCSLLIGITPYFSSLLPVTRACHGPALVGWPINFLYHRTWLGPAHQLFTWRAAARPGPSKLSSDGPRPGPVHQLFRGWVTARSSPSHFQIHGLARPGPSDFHLSARPGPAHDIGSEVHGRRALTGRPAISVGRAMCCPEVNGARICSDDV